MDRSGATRADARPTIRQRRPAATGSVDLRSTTPRRRAPGGSERRRLLPDGMAASVQSLPNTPWRSPIQITRPTAEPRTIAHSDWWVREMTSARPMSARVSRSRRSRSSGDAVGSGEIRTDRMRANPALTRRIPRSHGSAKLVATAPNATMGHTGMTSLGTMATRPMAGRMPSANSCPRSRALRFPVSPASTPGANATAP